MPALAIHQEPGVVPSGVLAVLVHLGFFALLFFGVHWQTKVSEPMMVDVWEEIPAVKTAPVVEPPPPPKVEKIEAKPPPPPPAPAEPKVEQPSKADILLKEKQQALERKKEEAARKKEELRLKKETEIEDKRRKELEQRQVEEEKRLQEVARRRDEAMLEDLIKKEEKNKKEADAARKQQSIQARVLDEHISRIRLRIQSKVIVPPSVSGNPEAHYKVTLLPGGEVLEVHLVRSSGVPAYDLAVERAIKAAEPLPVPSEPDLFQQMRVIDLKFRPLQ